VANSLIPVASESSDARVTVVRESARERGVGIADEIREVVRHRDLLYTLTWREVKIRYKQSVMGFLWALLMPLVIVGAGVIVRFAFASASGSAVKTADIAAVAVKSAPYAFLVAGIRTGTSSLIANSTLLTKVYMPRMIFPLSAVLAQLLDFAVASTVLGLFVLVLGVGVSVQLLWLPILFLALLMLVVGAAVLLSAAGLFFRDVKYLVEVLLTFAIFFVPVFFDASMMGKWKTLILLNPVSPILDAISATVVRHHAPELGWLAYSLAFGTAFLVFAMSVFRKLEPYFAESV
jgi:homopolymeric O-antigen transport system permease protein